MNSSRDNWERLVVAVLRREELWQLCHQPSPSISSASISSDSDSDFSGETLNFSSNTTGLVSAGVIVQEIESSGIELFVELLNVDSVSWNEPSVPSNVATSDVRAIMEPTQADFINDDEEDETLDEYIEDNENGEDREGDEDEFIDDDDEDDDNDMDDEGMRDISSDDE